MGPALTDRWKVLTGAVAGADHARRGEGCQDSFVVERSSGALIAAVADGGSRLQLSAAGSALVAAMAVGAASALLSAETDGAARGARFWNGLLRELAERLPEAFGRLIVNAADLVPGAQPRDFGTTLTLVVVDPPWLAVLSIGDGFVVVRSGTGHLDLLLPPDHGQSAAEAVSAEPGRTVFVSSPGAPGAAHTLVARIEDLTGVALSTDGLCELGLVYENALAHHPHEGFFAPVFAHAAAGTDDTALLRLLASQRVCSLTGDDKTLVVAVPR